MDQTKGRDKHPLPGKEKPVEHPAPAVDIDEDEVSIESVPLYRNFKLVIPVFVLLVGLAIVAYYWYMGMREFVSTDDAFIDANRVAVSTKILGRIDTLTVDEGDTVKAGQILVRLDDTDLRAQQAQARTSLALAQENISLANVSLDKAQTDFKRASQQFKDNITTREQFEHAQSELETAKARLGIAVAQANSARAQIAVVETQIRNTVVVSPMTGVVSKRWVLSGDVVSAGQPVFTLYDLKNVWVTANLEETSISVLRSADKVEIKVDAYPERQFTGQVLQIGSNTSSQFSLIPPNNASGNFTKVTQRVPVKISIQPVADSPATRPPELLPGMSVEVKVKVK
jgi:membrane fusion protein (multidrug efflux system)